MGKSTPLGLSTPEASQGFWGTRCPSDHMPKYRAGRSGNQLNSEIIAPQWGRIIPGAAVLFL
jgi:hypothetical protein